MIGARVIMIEMIYAIITTTGIKIDAIIATIEVEIIDQMTD